MKNKIFRYFTILLSGFYGKIRLQKFFKALFYVALDGLHYGKVHNIRTDGEYWLLNNLNKDLESSNEPIIIFDAGANQGDYTLIVSEVFGQRSFQIHLFEPGNKAYNTLQSKFSGEKWILNNFGLGKSRQRVVLNVSNSQSDISSIHYESKGAIPEEIELLSIDEYCGKNSISYVHLLKLDVEGHEYDCLLGAKHMLKKHRIFYIQFEFGKSNIFSRIFFRDIYNYLNNMGYNIFRLVKDGLVPITEYHHSLEIFYTTNYVAKPEDIEK